MIHILNKGTLRNQFPVRRKTKNRKNALSTKKILKQNILEKKLEDSWIKTSHFFFIAVIVFAVTYYLSPLLPLSSLSTHSLPLNTLHELNLLASNLDRILLEESVYDSDGQLLTTSFLDYAMPRADDLPEFQSLTFTDAPCLTNPLGAKGVGEIGTVGSIPTIANAILDALWDQGVRKFDMPAYPQKIWKILLEAKNLKQ